MFIPGRIQSVLISTLIAGSVLFSYTAVAQNRKPQAEVLHWWSSAGESAALNVLIDEFKSRGGHYYDSTKTISILLVRKR